MPRSRFRRVMLGLGLALGGLVLLLLIAVGGGVLWLLNADVKAVLMREASEALGRKVTVGSLTVALGDPLRLEFTDLRIANAPWGSQPDMAKIAWVSAMIDVGPLWHGVLRYEGLRIDDLTVVLERDPSGIGNWKFGSAGGTGGFAIVPKDRTQFPTLIDFLGQRALITYRTRSGDVLRIALDEIAIASPGDDTPVKLQAKGAYNDVALKVDGVTDSFAKMRDADEPFGARFALATKDTDVAFGGTMMEPLDFEGVRGKLKLEARTMNDLMGVFGARKKIDLPLTVAGDLARDGDHWSLTDAKGRLAKADFTGDLALLEGKSAEPDDITLDLDFGSFDLNPILAATGADESMKDWQKMPLYPAGLDGVKLSAALATPLLSIGKTRLPDFALEARAAGGKVALKALRFDFGGGTLAMSGGLASGGKTSKLALNARLKAAQAAAIAAMLGGTGEEIRGRLDGAATLGMQGATLGEGFKHSSGAALLTLAKGDVARSLIEAVSADLRSLFRKQEGRMTVTCLLAAMSLKDGVGELAPLRLETDAAILQGKGTIDLVQKRLDLTLKTERDSTNFFALDLPIRVSGPFAAIRAEPQLGAEADMPAGQGAAAAIAKLPEALRDMAEGNACLQ